MRIYALPPLGAATVGVRWRRCVRSGGHLLKLGVLFDYRHDGALGGLRPITADGVRYRYYYEMYGHRLLLRVLEPWPRRNDPLRPVHE